LLARDRRARLCAPHFIKTLAVAADLLTVGQGDVPGVLAIPFQL